MTFNTHKPPLSPERRYTFVHNTITYAHNALKIPEVNQRLGRLAGDLSNIVETSLPVSLTPEGIVDIGDEHRDRLAITALGVGENAVRLTANHMIDARQVTAISNTWGNDRSAWIRAQQAEINKDMFDPLRAFNGELGYVNHQIIGLPGNMELRGRPLILLNYHASELPHADVPLFLHEATHVHQLQRSPILNYENGNNPKRQSISNELEAYHVAAMVILGIQDANLQKRYLSSMPQVHIDYALQIEKVRQSNTDTDSPFSPNNQVIGALADNKLAITAGIKELIQHREDQ